jgi:hypothetical protein
MRHRDPKHRSLAVAVRCVGFATSSETLRRVTAAGAARFHAAAALNFTDTRRETPGSCMVTP